jgi:hypothetical protein
VDEVQAPVEDVPSPAAEEPLPIAGRHDADGDAPVPLQPTEEAAAPTGDDLTG